MWTDELVEGGREFWVDADLDSMPIFIKEGAVIPKYPVQQYVGEKVIEEVTLDVYYTTDKEDSFFFDDAHDGFDYIKGRYNLSTFKLRSKKDELIIKQHKKGSFKPSYSKFKVVLHGLPFEIGQIEIDKEIMTKDQFDAAQNSIIVDHNFEEIHIFKMQ